MMENAGGTTQAADQPVDGGQVQLTVHFDVMSEQLLPRPGWPRGGCRVSFGAPEESILVKKYGGKARALAACRDMIVEELDFVIQEFFDEE
jgi:hypothetical protein